MSVLAGTVELLVVFCSTVVLAGSIVDLFLLKAMLKIDFVHKFEDVSLFELRNNLLNSER